MNLIKSLISLNEANDPEYSGALAKFDKWYNKSDLWHPGFPTRFATCVEDYFPDADVDSIQIIGQFVQDNYTSFYADRMEAFLEFVKTNPIPSGFEDEDDPAVRVYMDKADESMVNFFKNKK